MRHNEGYHRGRDAWQLSERQRQILDGLSEGETNPQIAERLGITTDGVKWHVGELLAATGCEDRRALARWWRERRRAEQGGFLPLLLSWRVLWLPAGITAAVVVVLVVMGIMDGSTQGPGSDDQPIFADVGDEEPEVKATVLPDRPVCPEMDEDLSSVDADGLRIEGLVYVSEAFSRTACPILIVNRSDRSFVRLPLDATIFGKARRANLSGRFPVFSARLPVDVGGDEITIRVSSYTTYTGPGQELAVTADDSEGRVYRTAVDSDGGLWLSPLPLPEDTVRDYWTGEVLDVRDARRLGKLEPAGQFHFTYCGVSPRDASCKVSYRPLAGFLAPIAGTVRCWSRDEGQRSGPYDEPVAGIELDAGDFILRFERLHTGASQLSRPENCEEREVRRGDPLGNHYHYAISATSVDGSPLSVAVALDGTLVVGDFRSTLDCPCTQGN